MLRQTTGPGELTASARAHWLMGLRQMQSGQVERALESYRASMLASERAREYDNAAAVAGTAADTLRVSGDQALGWRYLMLALKRLPDVQSVRRRYTLLLNASLYATDDSLTRAAMAFQEASLDAARRRGVPSTIAEGLIRRATLRSRRGDYRQAAEDLREADLLVRQITSTTSREYQVAWWNSASAEMLIVPSPDAAIDRARAAIAQFAVIEPSEVPRMRLLEGRAYLALGDDAAARSAFERGVEAFVSRWAQLRQSRSQISYLDESWALFQELVELDARGGDFDTAFRRAEGVRALTLRGAGELTRKGPPLDEIARQVPVGTALLYYALLDRRLVIWCIGNQSWTVETLPTDSATLSREVSAYRRVLEIGGEPTTTSLLSRRLYTQLIAPVKSRLEAVRTLVFIGDAAIQAVPFATLTDPETGQYLVERHAVATSPSVSEFLVSSSRLALEGSRRIGRALVVGASEPSRELGLPQLPEAAREVEDVSRVYRDATILRGGEATPQRLRALAGDHAVLHFAGHARSDLRFPAQSDLILWPDPQHPAGRLTAAEIAEWRLPDTILVALSACRTAYGPVYKGEGVVGLARPFLRAGVPTVVGSLWDVRDTSSRRLLGLFHQRFSDTGDPVASLRQAQLQLLRDPDRTMHEPSHWGAYTLITGITAPSRVGLTAH